jgi:hypothetical protein
MEGELKVSVALLLNSRAWDLGRQGLDLVGAGSCTCEELEAREQAVGLEATHRRGGATEERKGGEEEAAAREKEQNPLERRRKHRRGGGEETPQHEGEEGGDGGGAGVVGMRGGDARYC